MAEILELSNLTLNTQEARETSDIIFKKAFLSPEIEAVHNVMTGVDTDKFIPIFGNLGLVGKEHVAGCARNEEDSTIPVSEKKFAPKLIEGMLVVCVDDIPDLFKAWKKSRVAANTWEDVNGEYMSFIEDRTLDAIKKSTLRHAEFGYLLASPVGDATGNEILTVGTDKAFFNVMDGMFAQIEADAALPTPLGYRVTISENALATKSLQMALGATTALDTFRALYDNVAPEAMEGMTPAFQVTRSLFTNWLAFLEDKSLSFTLNQAETKGGTTGYTYRGIPIVVRTDWDRTIKAYFDNGTTYHLPHRAILSDLVNIPIGTKDEGSLKDFSSKFIDLGATEKHYIKYAYTLDMKILEESQLAYAI